jgi:hypothetical protein
MSLPDYDALRPGIRLPLCVDGGAVPAPVAGPLLDQGRACNNLGAALAVALLDKDRAIEQEQRADSDPNLNAHSVERQTNEALLDLIHDRIDRITALYADTAAQYVVDAVEAAGQASRGEALTPSAPRPITAADVVLLTQIYLPLIQIDTDAVTDPTRQRRIRVENEDLANTHRLLMAVIAEIGKPENLPCPPSPMQRFILEPELGAALHHYAAGSVVALALMSRSSPRPPH